MPQMSPKSWMVCFLILILILPPIWLFFTKREQRHSRGWDPGTTFTTHWPRDHAATVPRPDRKDTTTTCKDLRMEPFTVIVCNCNIITKTTFITNIPHYHPWFTILIHWIIHFFFFSARAAVVVCRVRDRCACCACCAAARCCTKRRSPSLNALLEFAIMFPFLFIQTWELKLKHYWIFQYSFRLELRGFPHLFHYLHQFQFHPQFLFLFLLNPHHQRPLLLQ